MSKAAAPVVFLLLCSLARAQEPIPTEDAQRVGRQLAEIVKGLGDAQVKTDVDPDKAGGLHADKRGALAIPNKDLSEERLNGAEKDVVPVGQLWCRGVAPVVDGQVPGRERLRLINVTIDDKDHELALLLLGARRSTSGETELLIYGKDKEPLARLPLKKSGGGAQDLPIVLDVKKNDDATVDLTLKILGKFEAVMKVGHSPD